jgi:tRNA dimethylallyltransferase
LNALQTVGYRELFYYIDWKTQSNNERTLEDSLLLGNAVEQIKINTRRIAKRQLTWFKRNKNTVWFDFQTETSKIINTISDLITNAK